MKRFYPSNLGNIKGKLSLHSKDQIMRLKRKMLQTRSNKNIEGEKSINKRICKWSVSNWNIWSGRIESGNVFATNPKPHTQHLRQWIKRKLGFQQKGIKIMRSINEQVRNLRFINATKKKRTNQEKKIVEESHLTAKLARYI